MADIQSIRNNWGAKAAAGDAFDRVPNDATFVAIWISKEGRISWAKSNTDLPKMALIAAVLDAWVANWIDQDGIDR